MDKIACQIPIEVKAVGEDGVFEGFASTFGDKDLGGDIVERGAFAPSIKQRGPRGIKMLADHDPTKRIGVWEEMIEDGKGLFVRGRLLLEKTIAKEAYVDLKAGVLNSMSIGGITRSESSDGRRRARIIKEFDLWEVSLVTFPMNPAALVTAVKSWDEMTIREIEDALESGTLPRLSSRAAKALLSGGFKAMKSARDAGGQTDEVAALMDRFKALRR